MKLVIGSDIHGSADRCRELVIRYQEEKADKLVLLGDILYHGPRNPLPEGHGPMEVARMLNAMKEDIICVRGNCDAEIDEMVLEFPLIGGFTMISEPKRTLFLTHGHIFNEMYLPPMKAGDVLLHGHTHVKVAKKLENGGYLVNPGSTSVPKDCDYGSYAVYDGEKFEIKKLTGETVMTLALE